MEWSTGRRQPAPVQGCQDGTPLPTLGVPCALLVDYLDSHDLSSNAPPSFCSTSTPTHRPPMNLVKTRNRRHEEADSPRGREKPSDVMREVFANRMHEAVDRLVENADAATIQEAMGMADSLGGLAVTIQRIRETGVSATTDPLAAALIRGSAERERLLTMAGGLLRLGEVAEHLGITPQAVTGRRTRETILAVPQRNGEWVYPACQFTEDGLLGGIDAFVGALPTTSPWTRLQLLLGPAERYGGKPAIEFLREGKIEEALSIAGSYERQG